MNGWQYHNDGQTPAHVWPTDDTVTHDLTDECVCGPTSTPITRDDGSIGWLITHHALDGRA